MIRQSILKHFLALSLALALIFSVQPAEAAKNKVGLQVVKSGKAPNLKKSVAKQIARKLKKSVKLVSDKALKKAIKKEGFKGKSAKTVEGSLKGLSTLGAVHLVFFESQEDPANKKKKKKFLVAVTVIDVVSGQALFEAKYPLKKKKLNKKTAKTIVAALVPVLTAPVSAAVVAEAPPAEAPAEEAAVEAAVPPPPPPPPAPEVVAEKSEPAVEEVVASDAPVEEAAATEPAAVEAAPADAPVEEVAADAAPEVIEASSDSSQSEPLPEAVEAAPEVLPVGSKAARWRPAIELDVGGKFSNRSAQIDADHEAPAYSGPISALYARLALFPLALNGKSDPLAGIGLVVDGAWSSVESTVNDQTAQSLESNVLAASVGVAYRYVMWDSADAPDVLAGLGYSTFRFPLSSGPFPGVAYSGAYLDVEGNMPIPVKVPMVSLISVHGGIRLMPMVSLSERLDELGDDGSSWALRADLGGKVSFGMFNVGVMGSVERYASSFSGTSSLPVTEQFEDASLTELILGGRITGGMTF